MSAQSSVDPKWTGIFSTYPRDLSLGEQFAAQAAATPAATALQSGSARLSYGELAARAAQLAHALRARGVGSETPVGVLMRAGVAHIVAQVASALLGASCVPLDPEYPRERLTLMIEDAGVALIVADEEAALRALGDARPGLCVTSEAAQIAALPRTLAATRGGAERCTHILYTSGSTGRPKGIEIVGRAINRLVLATDYVQISARDRVAQIASFSFDAALFEVWGALLNGATIVQLPRRAILDPQELAAELRTQAVSVMFLTTALFNFTAQADPRAFAGLRCLMVGGERANPQTMQAVLSAGPPGQLLHAYGPTEATTFTTMHPLSLAEVAGPTVAIGSPIRNSQVFILDEARRPVGVGVPGELHVGGDGLARGYLNRPELNAERFVSVEGLRPEGPVRLYRSGDLAQWRSDGAIEFIGRTDFQVKLRGFRIELEEVEAALMASELLTAAAVVVETDAAGDGALVAHIVPYAPGAPGRAALQQYIRARLPPYMLPARFREHACLPLNDHGKIDRAALKAAAPASASTWGPSQALRGDLDAAVAAIWCELLGTPELAPEDDFFQVGGDSLRAARLMLRVRATFRVDLPFCTPYECSRLGEFIAAVRRAQAGVTAPSEVEDGPETWRRDARLPPDLAAALASRGPGTAPPLAAARTLFLTGATGFLGAFLLRDLLHQTRAQVLCLVRASSPAAAAERVRQSLAKYGLWEPEFAARVRALPGDLRAPRLGLSVDEYAAVAAQTDHIFHSGAHVHYVEAYPALRAGNVDGTLEVLRLASSGHAALHHVSSIAVFGPTGYFSGIEEIHEDEPLEPHVEHLRYDMGYSASKWVAEQLVWAAARHGLPVRVYRPGFIMGDSRRGVGDDSSFISRLLLGCVQLGVCPDLPRQRKEFVTVDFVSAGIVRLAASEGPNDRAYHLIPPDLARSPDIHDLFALLAACGYPLETLPYPVWAARLSQDPQIASNPLCPLIPMLLDPVYLGQSTRWELYERMPRIRSERTHSLLAGLEPGFHAMDTALLARHLEHWRATGSLAPPQAQRQLA